ncbi:MAG: hypothetical protein C3F07_06475 [Anaerolineales bacterium]|nr:hypothetical protein [Anaerolineae bacterium]PWB75085.1 MAG: hypothetical protein C3F07_06475 [Anaerolineales bacterium]
MQRNWISVFLLFIIFTFITTACARNNTVCPADKATPRSTLRLADLIELPPPASASSESIQVEIGGRKMDVNILVDYPLCNDNWSGVVYVSCDAQVAEADLDANSNPLFLKGCNLNIAPNTVVYVAAHNDAPYYKGCSCHTGTLP